MAAALCVNSGPTSWASEALHDPPSRAREIREAAQWYRARSPIAAEGFLDAVDSAIDAIVEHPEAWPRRGDRHDVRAFPLRRYPFAIVYRVRPTVSPPIRVLAVAHARRRPDYWTRRR